jgi:pimeloyl-ACP methyl ester carboxylesterase
MTREAAVQFGAANNLEGVLTRPENPAAAAPALILLSAGLLHKVGPNRLHPVLARQMADRGLFTLRFDMQGMGDSRPAKSAGTLTEQTHDSVCAAMDWVTRETGVERFILGGLCSGAEDGFRVAVRDDRVVGLMLLDAHAYPTPRFKLHNFWYRARRKILREMGYYLDRGASDARPDEEAAQRYGFIEFPDREWVAESLRSMIDRGVKFLYVYSGSWSYYSYRRQFFDMFSGIDFKGAATVYFFRNQDHTVTLRHDQERLVNSVQRWYDTAIG